jgi:cell division protein ftsZ
MAEVISKHYLVNIDLRDARTVLENGGTAIMGSASAEGDNRAYEAVAAALNSPLLNDNKIAGAKNALLLITYGKKEATQREVTEISSFIQEQAGDNMADLIYGIGEDESLGEAISVIVIATGFDADQQQEIVNAETKKVIHILEENQTATRDLTEPKGTVVNAISSSYPISSISDIKKESSLSDLFNIWVDCEIVTAVNDEFVIVDKSIPKKNSFQTIEKKAEVQTQQSTSVKHEEPQKEAPIIHQLSEDIHKEAPQVERRKNPPIVNQEGEIRYTLEDYTELERTFIEAKPTSFTEDKNSNEFILYKKEEDSKSKTSPSSGQLDMFAEEEDIESSLNPIDSRISDVMKRSRSNRLQDYNYKFGSNNQSRTSMGKDSAGEMQIRKNNSYLHDNVD